jgi:hypothetical protein
VLLADQAAAEQHKTQARQVAEELLGKAFLAVQAQILMLAVAVARVKLETQTVSVMGVMALRLP